MIKPFKTLDEQIDILPSRGLIITDRLYAKEILSEVNYYFINGYKNLLLKEHYSDNYKTTATFQELCDLYVLDRKIKILTLDILLQIEQKVKTTLAYEICKRYGNECSCYQDINYYDKTNKNTEEVIKKIKVQIDKSKTKNKAIKHYIEKHDGNIPLWVAIKVLTFGVVRKMYMSLKSSDKDVISKRLLCININKNRAKIAETYLELIVDARNECAHDEMFMNFIHNKVMIPLTSYHKEFVLLKNNEGYVVGGRKDLFALLIAVKHFAPQQQYKEYIMQLKQILENHILNVNSYSKKDLYNYIHLPLDFERIIDL